MSIAIANNQETVDIDPITGYKVFLIPIEDIFLDENFNCRGNISPIDVLDLARDIKDRKLDTPITVQPHDAISGKKYRIVAGHRRFTAFEINALDADPVVAEKHSKIPCFIEEGLDETAARTQNLRENLHRKQLNILQEAYAIKYYFDIHFNEVEVADLTGTSRGWVQIRKALLSLPKEIQAVAAAGLLTQAQIKHCASLRKVEQQIEFVKKVKEKREKGESLSVVPSIQRSSDAMKTRERKGPEIVEMGGLIYDTLGACLATRFAAWCTAKISTIELLNEVQAAARKEGKDFIMPSWVSKALVGDKSE
jgi:ParB/RepB/Spo0J family partition protein